jgi:hypothetical protein
MAELSSLFAGNSLYSSVSSAFGASSLGDELPCSEKRNGKCIFAVKLSKNSEHRAAVGYISSTSTTCVNTCSTPDSLNWTLDYNCMRLQTTASRRVSSQFKRYLSHSERYVLIHETQKTERPLSP